LFASFLFYFLDESFMFSFKYFLLTASAAAVGVKGTISSGDNADSPSQVHLALGGPGEFSVTWFTGNEALISPTCHYGATALDLSSQSVGSSLVYLEGYGAHHSVILTDLVPSSQYFYQCGDQTSEETTALFSFKTPPSATEESVDPLSFLIFGGKEKKYMKQETHMLSAIQSISLLM
jgi:hypothetical protein